jgi:hypothetical protein
LGIETQIQGVLHRGIVALSNKKRKATKPVLSFLQFSLENALL